jgi:putative spermidine/putrescine transport system permease protein
MGSLSDGAAGLTRRLLFAAVAGYLLLPMLAVVLASLATAWTTGLLPDGYTLAHWAAGLANPRLQAALGRTAGLALATLLLDVAVVVPAAYWQRVRNPRIRVAAEAMAAIPFALPFVVIAFGVLRLGDAFAPRALGTPGLLLLAHAAVAFPFLYWAVDGAMAAADVVTLNEAAQMCGASAWQTLRLVLLPSIGPGLAAGGMLVFAVSYGEFALVQILAGARFENVSLLSLDLLARTNADFPTLAVLTTTTFAILFAISLGVVAVNRGTGDPALAAGGPR